jgi:hypothetical protein
LKTKLIGELENEGSLWEVEKDKYVVWWLKTIFLKLKIIETFYKI